MAGDVAAALASSARQLSGQLRIGSQRHFYMEPQTAVATPEEAGRISVVSSSQGCDQVSTGLGRAALHAREPSLGLAVLPETSTRVV